MQNVIKKLEARNEQYVGFFFRLFFRLVDFYFYFYWYVNNYH